MINYDDEFGRTDSVTGGDHVIRTVYIYHNIGMDDFDFPRLKSFIGLVRALKEISGKK